MTIIQASVSRGKSTGRKANGGNAAADFLQKLIRNGEPIFAASYANNRDEKDKFPPADRRLRDPADVAAFIKEFDVPGRAVYFCPNTMIGRKRRKDFVKHINSVFVDLDFKGIVESPKRIEAVLKKLKLRPTAVVASGHGFHCYWVLDEPLSPESTPSAEALMRRICEVLAGDVSAAEVARVLRLPGSHNTKNGEWLDVKVIEVLSSWVTYAYAEIDRVFEDLRRTPLLSYKPSAVSAGYSAEPRNGFQQLAHEERRNTGGFSIKKALTRMKFGGVHKNGIDDTYTAVVGAMVHRGESLEDCIKVLLEPTRLVYERDRKPSDGAWNERRAAREITSKFRYFQRKDAEKPKPEAEPQTTRKTNGAATKKTNDVEHHQAKPNGDTTTAKPTFTVEGGELSNLTTAAEQALIDAGEELYEQTSGTLVRPIKNEVDAAHGRRTTVAELKPVKHEYLRDRLTCVANWQRYNEKKEDYVPVNCPPEIAITLLSREGGRKFPKLAGILTSQTMRHDGSLLMTEGYDPRTRLLLVDPPKLKAMPEKPTKGDAEAALKLIVGLLREFPFTDDVAKAVAVAAIVTAVCRGAFANAPLFIARASTPGSGKSFLWDIVSAIVSGFPMPVIAAGRSEEETEKRLGAALMAAQPLVSIDNANGELGGDALCQIIERPIVDVRILGQSRMVRIESRGTTMFATGNNLTVVGDLCRRVLIASLDSKLERPELRTFKGEPVKKVLADRGKFVAACLTICRAYMLAGRPDKAKALASFGDWSDCVRSALIWLGMADPVASMEIARAEDPEHNKHRDLLLSWHGLYGSKPVTLAKVIEDATAMHEVYYITKPKHPELHDAVDVVAGWRGPPDTIKLSGFLRRKKQRPCEGLRLMNAPNEKGGSLWWVEAVKA